MNFHDDIRQYVLAKLPCDPSARKSLGNKDAFELLVIWCNWIKRLINPRPRNVHRSHALWTNPLASDPRYASALENIARNLALGSDLTPYLSSNIRCGYENDNAAKNSNRALDLMLNDWGVHHLHLSTDRRKGGFVKRTGPLLFVFIDISDAYLIDIGDHKSWVSRHLFEVMVREWPDKGLFHEVKGVVGLSREISEREHQSLRNKHGNTFMEVDGKIYMPSGGMTSAGTPLRATIEADMLLDCAERWQAHLLNNPDYLPDIMRTNGMILPPSLDIHFAFFEDGGYGVVERCTGIQLKFGE